MGGCFRGMHHLDKAYCPACSSYGLFEWHRVCWNSLILLNVSHSNDMSCINTVSSNVLHHFQKKSDSEDSESSEEETSEEDSSEETSSEEEAEDDKKKTKEKIKKEKEQTKSKKKVAQIVGLC